MQDNELIREASKARTRAYAPYSKFAVGAALLTSTGKIFAGCNVENVSLGLTICAERAALAAAIAQGCRDFEAIAVVTDSNRPAFPCGACRQVLAEFNPKMKVVAANAAGEIERSSLNELLPVPTQGLLSKSKDV
jgi:cytidine deaminase